MTRVSFLAAFLFAAAFLGPEANAQGVADIKPRCETMALPAKQECLLTRALEAEHCSAIQDNHARLACYDKLIPVATLSGSSSGEARCADEKDEDKRRRCRLTLAGRLPDCAVHTDLAVRLACTDSIARERAASAATGKIPVDPALGWKLRDEVAVNAIGLRAVSKSGAKLGYTEDKGKESLKGSVAALYVWDNTTIDWQPFAGIAWKGDNGATPKSESVTFSAGAQTSLRWLGITSQPSLLVSKRHERYVDRDSTQITFNNDLLFDDLQGLTSGGVAYDFVPLLGLNAAKVSSSAIAAGGVTTGAYAGMRFTLGHKKLFPRTTLEGFGQWYGDARELPSTERRRVRYGTLKIVHNLADPEAKTGWVPAITLTGIRGTEPVRGDVALRKVSLEFSVRLD